MSYIRQQNSLGLRVIPSVNIRKSTTFRYSLKERDTTTCLQSCICSWDQSIGLLLVRCVTHYTTKHYLCLQHIHICCSIHLQTAAYPKVLSYLSFVVDIWESFYFSLFILVYLFCLFCCVYITNLCNHCWLLIACLEQCVVAKRTFKIIFQIFPVW